MQDQFGCSNSGVPTVVTLDSFEKTPAIDDLVNGEHPWEITVIFGKVCVAL